MKKINRIALGLLMTGVMAQSCKKEFQEANTNPGQLNDTKPEFLFTAATLNYTYPNREQVTTKYSSTLRYMQYIVGDDAGKDAMESPYADPTKTTFPSPPGVYYRDYFGMYGRDYHRIIDKISTLADTTLRSAYANLGAICRIMDTYDAWKIADMYGALPYTQAFNASQFPLPKYDYDYELYKLFDTQLKDAATVLKNTVAANQVDISKQDFFYAGNADKWMRFANTLRIKIAQRYEKRDAQQLTAVLTDVATNFAGKIISSNAEGFGYDNVRDWNNNIDELDAIQTTYDAAFPYVEFLKSTNDPRLPLLVRPNDWGTNAPAYNDIKANGTAAAKTTLDSIPLNRSRYVGKHVFSASSGAAYGWEGQAKTHQFTVTTGTGTTTRTLNYISLINGRLFVKNSGFKPGNTDLHTDETVVDGSTIKMRTSLMNYAGVCFMMAEIASKGGNGLGKSAAQWYTDGVTASFDFYKEKGIQQGMPGAAATALGDFLTRYPYNGLPSVYSQFWVNSLVEPEEAWATWKRTGYPQFDNYRAGQANKIGDGSGIAYLENLYTGTQNLLIPRRYILQITSSELTSNLDKAVADMKAKDAAFGVDRLDSRGRVWWDMQ